MTTIWTYDDIYHVIVGYITEFLVPQNLVLNFSVIALCQTSPKAIVRLTLKDLATNHQRQWEVEIQGESLQELKTALHASIEENKTQL